MPFAVDSKTTTVNGSRGTDPRIVCITSSGLFSFVRFHRPTSERWAIFISPARKLSGFCMEPIETTQSRSTSILFLLEPSKLQNRTGHISTGCRRAMREYIERIVRDCSSTSDTITLFQPERWNICTHAISICVTVEPPHCRALTSTTRTGFPANKSVRRICASLSWARRSLNGTRRPVVLSKILTQEIHQNSKSYTARSRCTTPHMTSAAMPSRAAYCSTPPASMIAATVGVWAMYVGIST